MLHLDGEDLERLTLEQRKERLRELLARAPAGSPLRYCDHVLGNGPVVFEHARKLGAEGIVSKRRDRRHRPGRSTEWLKSKCTLRQEFVLGGFTHPEGTRSGVGALLLGHYDDERLVFTGRVGTGKGWTGAFLEELRDALNKIEQDDCPFEPKPPREVDRAAHWVQPALVAEVEFVEWTSDGSVRHPTFCGFRTDVRVRDVRRESAVKVDADD